MSRVTNDWARLWGARDRPISGADVTVQPYANRQSRTQEMMDVVNRTTNQRFDDIRYGARGRSAAIGQRLARIGMGNTTVGSSLRAGVEREKQAELNRAEDAQQQSRLGILGGQAGFVEADEARQIQYETQLRTSRLQAQAQMAAAKSSAAPNMMREKARQAVLRRAGIKY